MKSIGIIANPASGKDIRRLVSHATVVDNHEKINIVERIILAAQGYGVEKIYIMPDTYQIGYKVIDNLDTVKARHVDVEVLKMRISGSHADSTNAAQLMVDAGVGCILALGGDGTCRAVAKTIGDVPFIGLSTGTNNAYPEMIEGTIAGIAAAYVSEIRGVDENINILTQDKRIEVYINGEFKDIALIDAVVARSPYVGAKAIWDIADMDQIIVTRGHPSRIGFSSIVGSRILVKDTDPFGVALSITEIGKTVIAPLAAGVVSPVTVGQPVIIKFEEKYAYEPDYKGTVALDGEREVVFGKGDLLEFKICNNGPKRVNVKIAIEQAHSEGFFNQDRSVK